MMSEQRLKHRFMFSRLTVLKSCWTREPFENNIVPSSRWRIWLSVKIKTCEDGVVDSWDKPTAVWGWPSHWQSRRLVAHRATATGLEDAGGIVKDLVLRFSKLEAAYYINWMVFWGTAVHFIFLLGSPILTCDRWIRWEVKIAFQKSIVVHHAKYSYDLGLIWPDIKPHTWSIETRHTNESSCQKGKGKKNQSPSSSSLANCYCEQPPQPESLEVCRCSSLIPNIALILNLKLHVWHLNIYKSNIPSDRNDKHTLTSSSWI